MTRRQRHQQLGLAHRIPAILGWDDETRRGELQRLYGVRSTAALTDRQLRNWIDHLNGLQGRRPRPVVGTTRRPGPGEATNEQVDLIGGLAARLWGRTCLLRLAGLIRRQTAGRTTDPCELTLREAHWVAEQLKASLAAPPAGCGPSPHPGGLARDRLAFTQPTVRPSDTEFTAALTEASEAAEAEARRALRLPAHLARNRPRSGATGRGP